MFLQVFVFLSAGAVPLVPPPRPEDVVPGGYLIALHGNATAEMHSSLAVRLGGTSLSVGPRFKVVHTANTTASDLAWVLRQDSLVAWVEHNAFARLACPDSQTEPVSWGQVRVTSASPGDVYQAFAHNASWGEGVDVYILDTGVRCSHPEFARCVWGANFAGGANDDLNGHGTHCAGTVAGRTYGVAKAATIVAVKVLGDTGSGTWSGIIEGIQFAVEAATGPKKRPSVISMSLGGGKSAAVDGAVNAAFEEGVAVSVAAGNDNSDACFSSPAGATSALTVGSTELASVGGVQRDGRSSFSNYGRCVDLFAPGSSIVSAYLDDGYAALSGTSMACPHVSAALAVHLSQHPGDTSAEAKAAVIKGAMSTSILDRGIGSPDRFLHVQC